MLLRYLSLPVVLGSFSVCAFGQDFVSSSPDQAGSNLDSPDRVVIRGSNIPYYEAETANTATKTDTPLLDTPQTVTVIPRQLLDDQATLTIPEALSNVGGVNTGGTYRDYDIYSIRGFFGTGFTYLDGLRVDRQSEFQEDPFGLQRIEVIQGPASVLYGQIPPGGLVNLVSKMPQKTNFTNVSVGGGSFNLAETGVDTNGVLNASGSIYGRINLLWRQYGNFTDDVDPSQRLLFAPSLTIELGKHTTLTLLGQYYHDWRSIAFPLPAYGTVLPNPNGRITRFRNVGEPETYPNDADNWRVLLGYQFEHRFNDVFAFRQNARASFNETAFQGLYPSYLTNTTDPTAPYYYSRLERFSYDNHENYTTLGLDTSLLATFDTGPWAKHTALVGVDYYYGYNITKGRFGSAPPIDLYNPQYGAPIPSAAPFLSTVTENSQVGLYFQEQVKLFDRLSIVGGGREDFIDNDITQRIPPGSRSSDSPSAFSPRAGVVYEVLPKQVSAYFSWSKSFQSNPTYQSVGGGQIAPEEGEQYEFGAKADLFNGKLSSALAFYRIERTNVPTVDPSNPFFYVVTGAERHRGIDFNTTASPIKGWDTIFAYGYIDARVIEDNSGLTGKRPVDVPEHTFNLFTKYTIQDGALRGLGFGAGYHYQTNQAGDAANTFRLPSYGFLNLSAYYKRGRFSAQVNVNNVTNERYATGSYSNLYVQEGDPVNVRTSFGWHF